ncbi:MAG: mannose-1-phosphate guanylyltransferase [Candidatus Binatia bacterium]
MPRRRYAVVMAGGVGTRFWPWSREAAPKQLLELTSSRSMLAETIARLEGLVPVANIFVVTGRKYRRQVLDGSPSLLPANVLGEPVGRNTAPCIGWSTLEILRRCPDAVTAVLSADHVLGGGRAFGRDLEKAFTVADRNQRLVTFGIPPSGPATGFGYLRVGRAVAAGPACEVDAFVEKPNLATARRYISSGKYFWNSGMFVWRADVIWQELCEHLPDLVAGLTAMDRGRRGGSITAASLDRAWPRLPAISIDYGVLERSRRVAMLPASFSWKDIGSWDAVAELWPTDSEGNASRDPLLAVDSASNVVATRGKPVALLGVQGLVVVDAGDTLLVCSRERCQDVRAVVARLDKAGLGGLR